MNLKEQVFTEKSVYNTLFCEVAAATSQTLTQPLAQSPFLRARMKIEWRQEDSWMKIVIF